MPVPSYEVTVSMYCEVVTIVDSEISSPDEAEMYWLWVQRPGRVGGM